MRWLATLMAGFVAGAGVILLANPGTTPQVASAASASSSQINTGLPGQHIHNASTLAELQPDKALDAGTRHQLAAQLIAARQFALRYPTVADATAAGYRLAGGFAPGSGAHYISFRLTGSGSFDPTRPLSLIYDGTTPTSPVIGLMYYSMSKDHATFAGGNDHWHQHTGLCIRYSPAGLDVPFPADSNVSGAQCAAAGGTYLAKTGWMVHAWVVPGWESPQGVFSHNNQDVRCADGTYHTNKAGFCPGN
jgi:hypothetical protein